MRPKVPAPALGSRLRGKWRFLAATSSSLRVFSFVMGIFREWRGAWRIAGDWRSLVQLLMDSLLYRVLRFIPLKRENCERTLTLRCGVKVVYRLNRGDIQTIREVWMEEAYRLPRPAGSGVLIDLGANIGLTSLYLVSRYGYSYVLGYEPVAANADLARRNLSANGFSGRIMEAAVADRVGVERFSPSRDANVGKLSNQGKTRQNVVDMRTVLSVAPGGRADLLKVDIEGGEARLLSEAWDWLQMVDSLIIEFHPAVVDRVRLIETLKQAGFTYCPAGSAWMGSMDFFFRP